jgi:hypothetical protein
MLQHVWPLEPIDGWLVDAELIDQITALRGWFCSRHLDATREVASPTNGRTTALEALMLRFQGLVGDETIAAVAAEFDARGNSWGQYR